MTFARKEDRALLQGQAYFVADHKVPQLLEVGFVRTSYAHAKIASISTIAAARAPGVLGVFTAADLPVYAQQLPNSGRSSGLHSITDFTLARGETRYVGEPVAAVLADSRYRAEDAADLVAVDYEPLPVCASLDNALIQSTPLVHRSFGTNLVGEQIWQVGNVEAAFAEADFVIDEKLAVHRGTSSPMEPRGLIALPKEYNGGKFALEVIASTQSPYRLRDILAEMLQIPPREIWVRAESVGGGFGPKSGVYLEDFVVAWLALKCARPVRWIEDRREHLMCARQERDQIHHASLAFTKAGKLVGLKDTFLYDVGAYSTTVIIPWTTAYTIVGAYKIANVRVQMQLAFTHKVPTMTVRGAGRPEAIFVIERMLDRAAARLGIDPLELRCINAVRPQDLPWDTGLTSRDGDKIVYDNVDMPAALDRVAEKIDYHRLRRELSQANSQGTTRRGVGIACYIVTTGRGPYELARAKLSANGEVIVYTGACPQGQGHHTSLSQVCARELAISVDRVKIVSGDTEMVREGFGTFASRSAVTAGNAVAAAARTLRAELSARLGKFCGSRAEEFRWDGNCFTNGEMTVDFVQAVELLQKHGDERNEPNFPIEAEARFETKGHTYAAGALGVVIEVDADAGSVKVIKCVAAHEAGAPINSTIVEGQLQGGVAHGIGNSLLERVAYDDNGQMLSSTFKDYLLPLSTDVGDIQVVIMEIPAHSNPLGIKGVGESGTVGVAPAIAAAIEHALDGLGVKIHAFPITPEQLAQWQREFAP
jgi:carbon-monoxide dehydrogenase large subunit